MLMRAESVVALREHRERKPSELEHLFFSWGFVMSYVPARDFRQVGGLVFKLVLVLFVFFLL